MVCYYVVLILLKHSISN